MRRLPDAAKRWARIAQESADLLQGLPPPVTITERAFLEYLSTGFAFGRSCSDSIFSLSPGAIDSLMVFVKHRMWHVGKAPGDFPALALAANLRWAGPSHVRMSNQQLAAVRELAETITLFIAAPMGTTEPGREIPAPAAALHLARRLRDFVQMARDVDWFRRLFTGVQLSGLQAFASAISALPLDDQSSDTPMPFVLASWKSAAAAAQNLRSDLLPVLAVALATAPHPVLPP